MLEVLDAAAVRRWEWLTDMPKPGPLPHTSQVAATVISKHREGGWVAHGPVWRRTTCRQ